MVTMSLHRTALPSAEVPGMRTDGTCRRRSRADDALFEAEVMIGDDQLRPIQAHGPQRAGRRRSKRQTLFAVADLDPSTCWPPVAVTPLANARVRETTGPRLWP